MEETKSIVLSKEDFVEKDGNYLMSLNKLARMLGYKNPKKIYDLYRQYKDELSVYSIVSESGTTPGKEILHLNENGCYLMAMFARTDKAVEFRKKLASLIVDLRKKNLHLVPNEVVEQLKKELDKERLEKLMFRMRYYKAEQELKIRKIKGLNFTNAKIIEKMNAKRIPVDDIVELTGIKFSIVNQYLQTLIPAQESAKQLEEEKLLNKSFFQFGKDRYDLIEESNSSLTNPINYLNKGE